MKVLLQVMFCLLALPGQVLAQSPQQLSLEEKIRAEKDPGKKLILEQELVIEYCAINHRKALGLARETIGSATRLKDHLLLAQGFYLVGLAHDYGGALDSALIYYRLALAKSISAGNKEKQARYRNSVGNIYITQGNYARGLKECLAALKAAEESGIKKIILLPLTNIGNIYYFQHEYDKAIGFWLRSLSLIRETNEERYLPTTLSNIGAAYADLGKYPLAIKYHKEALEILKKRNDNFQAASALTNLGLAYTRQENIDMGLKYTQEAIDLMRKIGEEKSPYLIAPLNNAGNIYMRKGDFSSAIRYYNHSAEISGKIGDPEYLKISMLGISQAYEKKHEHAKTLEYYKKYMDLKDSLLSSESVEQINELQARYESEKKDNAIKLLSKDKALKESQIKGQQAEAERQKIIKNSFIAGFIIVIILAFLIFRGYRQKQKANLIIMQQKAETERQKLMLEEKQKEILDSIHYAKRIQRSLLTSEKYIARKLNEHSRGGQ